MTTAEGVGSRRYRIIIIKSYSPRDQSTINSHSLVAWNVSYAVYVAQDNEVRSPRPKSSSAASSGDRKASQHYSSRLALFRASLFLFHVGRATMAGALVVVSKPLKHERSIIGLIIAVRTLIVAVSLNGHIVSVYTVHR